MNETKRLKFIYKIIRENEGSGINELWQVIKKQHNEPMSRDTMIKTIKILENKGKITTISRGSQGKIVSTDLELPFYEKEGTKHFAEMLRDFEEKIEVLLNNWEKMSNPQRAKVCFLIIRLLSMIELRLHVFVQKIENPKTRNLEKKLSELKEWIYSISSSDPTDEGNLEHGKMVDQKSLYKITKYQNEIVQIFSKLG